MAFALLPTELLTEISSHMDRERDMNSLSRVSRRFHDIFDDELYTHNIAQKGSSGLFWAAEHGVEATARKMLRHGALVEGKPESDPRADPSGSTPLHLAANVEAEPDSDSCVLAPGSTPLHLAAVNGHLGMVKLLLDAGADPMARDSNRSTPLFYALLGKREEVARTIANCTKDVPGRFEISDNSITALHTACVRGMWGIAREFLEQGANVNAEDLWARTPLHMTLVSDLLWPQEVIQGCKLLLAFGADWHLDGWMQMDLESEHAASRDFTALEYGLEVHRFWQVRKFFKDSLADSKKRRRAYDSE